jgi:hypothetical protein
MIADATTAAAAPGPADLTCYTAALALYLSRVRPDAVARIATTVRLALRTGGTPAFSHHRVALSDLGDGRRLTYRAAPPSEAPARLARTLHADGAVLVVTHTGAMPWSPQPPELSAPHFTLVEQRRGDRWRVRDPFRALLPTGAQEPYEGWIGTATLLTAMTPPSPLRPEHRTRNRYVFGTRTPLPSGDGPQWLEPAPRHASTEETGGEWITDTDAVLGRLARFFTEPGRACHADDVWAAGRHHAFRYRHLLAHVALPAADREAALAAEQAWSGLPMALGYAIDSAARGRPRPSMLSVTFDALRAAERRCESLLTLHGYGRSPDEQRRPR